MSTPAEKAAAYITRLEAERRAALAVSEAKAEEAKLIKARREGFEEALKILGLQISVDNTEVEPSESAGRQRRNIPQLIMRELSFSGKAMAKEQIARAIDYLPSQTERALRRLESAGKIVENIEGRWEVVTSTVVQTNGHAITAAN
jgi:DNA-binding transcriptional ArsR family regulator